MKKTVEQKKVYVLHTLPLSIFTEDFDIKAKKLDPQRVELSAYRLEKNVYQNGKVIETSVNEGITSIDNLKKWDGEDNIEHLKMVPVLLDPKWKEQYQKWGHPNSWSGNKDWNSTIAAPLMEIQPYTYISQNPNWDKNKEIFKIVSYDYSLWNLNNLSFSKPIVFDYISSGIHNGSYHLEEMLDALVERDDIAFIKKDGGFIEGPVTDPQLLSKLIEDIPYYNRQEDQTETVQFLWRPEQAIHNQIQAHEQLSNYSVFEFIKENDFLEIEHTRVVPVASDDGIKKRKYKA